jgi:hypothetical protein
MTERCGLEFAGPTEWGSGLVHPFHQCLVLSVFVLRDDASCRRSLTETSTIKIYKHRQPFTLPTLTSPTMSLTMVFLPSRRPNTQFQAILTDIASTIQPLQIILQNLVSVNTARIRVEVLNTTRADLRSLHLRLWLGQRLWRCPSQVTQRWLSERDAQELAYVWIRGVDFAVDAAGGGLDGQLVMLSGSRAPGGRMGGC